MDLEKYNNVSPSPEPPRGDSKLKRAIKVILLLIFLFICMGAFHEDTFNISEWSKTTKFYINGGTLVMVVWVALYFTQEK